MSLCSSVWFWPHEIRGNSIVLSFEFHVLGVKKKTKKIQNKKKISNVPCGALAQDQNMNKSGMDFCEACDDLTSLPAIQMWCGWWPANRWHMSSHCPKMKCHRRIPWNKNKNNNSNYKTTTSIMDWWKKRWILPLIARSDNVQSRGIKSFIYPIFFEMISIIWAWYSMFAACNYEQLSTIAIW